MFDVTYMRKLSEEFARDPRPGMYSCGRDLANAADEIERLWKHQQSIHENLNRLLLQFKPDAAITNGGPSDRITVISAIQRQQINTIERLQAIVDKLPKTADGMTVTCELINNDVWTWHASGADDRLMCLTVRMIHIMECDTEIHGVDEYGEEQVVQCEDCYSTQEAAEAAKEKP